MVLAGHGSPRHGGRRVVKIGADDLSGRHRWRPHFLRRLAQLAEHRHPHRQAVASPDARMAECGPSATSGVISTPRLIGPGASSSTSGLAFAQPLAVHAEEAGVLADRGEQPAPLPLELDAQHVQHVAARQDVVEVVGDLDAEPVDARRARASAGRRRSPWPRAWSGPRCWSGRRGCGRCRRPGRPSGPSTRPWRWRMVKMSSRPCVGCSWAPSPALMTRHVEVLGAAGAAPRATEWRTTTTSTPIASMFLAVSMNVSPLRQAGAAGGEVERVGPEPPGGQAEAGAGAGGGLEEEVDDDLALEVVPLGLAAYPDAENLGGVEQSREFRGREPFETEQVFHESFQVPGSKFQVENQAWTSSGTWNLELGTWNYY